MEENLHPEFPPPAQVPGQAPASETPVAPLPEATPPPAPESPQPQATSSRRHKLKNLFRKLVSNKKLFATTLIVIFLATGSGIYWFVVKQPKQAVSSSQQEQNKSNTPSSTNSTKTQLPPATLITGSSYLNAPLPLSDLKLVKNSDMWGTTCIGENSTNCGPSVKLSDIKYYQIGTTKDGKKIIAFTIPYGPGTTALFALGNSDDTYDILVQMSGYINDDLDSYKKSFADNVKLDFVYGLNDAPFPIEVTIAGQKLKVAWETDPSMANANFMSNGLASIRGVFWGETARNTPQKIGDKDGLDYYRLMVKDEGTFQIIEFYGTFKNLFSINYNPAGEIASTKDNLAANWTRGEANSSKYFSGGQGCGTRGYVIAKNIAQSDLIAVGKSPKGQNLYQLPNSHPLALELFDKDYAAGELIDSEELKNLTIQQFADKHAYFLAENGLGEYVLFQREDMFHRGGCAKPVIYLYPPQTTKVSVRVGADVTKSEPTYPEGGWQNVVAEPNGSLQYNGSSYSSLFWEGYGHGSYPEITGGTIVKSADAASTVRSQLAQQGLNPTEISDFMTFWEPKLTTDKPYTRITWFNTTQLNRLAPLHVTPSPQTTIRVFMDFEGLDKSYSLAPQKFSAPKRSGFTLVEWGGLARNGLRAN